MRGAYLLVTLLSAPLLVGCLAADESLETGVLRAGPQDEHDDHQYAPVDAAEIRPGVSMHTPKRECPTNFLFSKKDNSSLFLGSTANCFRDMPVGTLVTVGGPENVGILVYSSWETMTQLNEQDATAREYNDFAVVRVDPSVRAKVNPTLLHVGGPIGVADAASLSTGARVRAYVNASEHAPEHVAWREGVLTGRVGSWALLVHSPLPATPGAMGGAVLTAEGEALGIMVNIGVLPNAGANGVARLDSLMKYAHENARLDMVLMTSALL